MKYLLLKVTFLCLLVLSINAQEKFTEPFDIRQYFVIEFADDKSDFYVRPDNFSDHPHLAEFGKIKFHLLEYYLENYGAVGEDYENLSQLLPDTNIVQQEVEHLLLTDTLLIKLVSNTLYRKDIGKIHVDSLLQIVSRFFYLHRLPSGKITMHVCIGINEVMDLLQNEHTPYLNAFCWAFVRTQNIWGLLYEDFVLPNQLDEDISDIALNQLKLDNYSKIIANQLVREKMIGFYQKHKAVLNFRLEY